MLNLAGLYGKMCGKRANRANQNSVGRWSLTHVVHQFSDHAVPLARAFLLRSVLAVLHQSQLIGEAQDSGQLSQQVDAEALETIVPVQWLIRLLEHHVRLCLWRENTLCSETCLIYTSDRACAVTVNDVSPQARCHAPQYDII